MPSDIEAALAELKLQMESLKPAAQPKLSMIVFSGDLDRMIAAMVLATGARAMGMQVVQFFTFWGTCALRDPKKKAGGKDFFATMLGGMLPKGRNRLRLSQMHMAGMGTRMIKTLMRRKNAPSLDQLFEMAAMLGVEIKICEMSMDLMGLRREEMIDYPNLEYCGVATFLAHAQESTVQLFL